MKKIIYFFFCIAIFTGLFQSCDSKDKEITGGIYGVVTDKATGETIKSAGVTLEPNGAITVTGSDGHFEFTNLTHGGYAVSINKTDYKEFKSGMITVEAGQTTYVDVQIEKIDLFGTLLGTVVEMTTGDMVAGALVTLTPSGKNAYTNADGFFEFIDLEAQQYAMKVQAAGYRTNRKLVTIVAGATEHVTITLQKTE